VVVDDDLCPFDGERSGARSADPAGRSGDEDALRGEPGLHGRRP
jgi:hypothetical protein